MPNRTVTRFAESDLEPVKIYGVLAEAANIPAWAPVFADAIERIDDSHFRVTKDGAAFDMEVFRHQTAGTADYVREMRGNKRGGGAYIRVIPRPLGGNTIIMTVPIGLEADELDVATILEQELRALIDLARS
jgi:hypothetical protein